MMLGSLVALAALTVRSAIAAPAYGYGGAWGPSGGIDWLGGEKIRGVNLGGWLVLEPWITPSLFERADVAGKGIVDEYTLCERLGTNTARDTVLKPHWDSWYSLADFQRIAASGFNLVRVPIGFWAYASYGTPYADGAAPYMDKAIDWARQTGLKVVIDLHGAPLSQNGFDNSGQKMATPQWQTGDSVQQTLDVLKTIQSKYGDSSYDDVVAAIQLLNEPLTPKLNLDVTKQFFRDGYYQQRDYSQSRVVMIHDGFQPPASYNGFLTPQDNNAQWVVLDHHEYQVFSDDLVALQPWQHRQLVCNSVGSYTGADKWSIIGEWSAAMTDCAKYLNGFGVGPRYTGDCGEKNDISRWTQAYKDDTRGYIEAQFETYEKYTSGWVFWTWHTESSPEWDVAKLIDAGIFPQPLSDRKFGVVCSD